MAKQAVGPVVRHLEKGVLAVVALVLLYVVAVYGVVSPNKVGPEDQPVGPTEVGQEVKAAAEQLRNRLQQYEPSPSPMPRSLQKLQEARDLLAAAEVPAHIPRPVPFGLPVPEFINKIQVGDKHDLVEVVQMQRPMLQVGRSGVFLAPPVPFGSGDESAKTVDSIYLQDVNWVTISGLFNRRTQEERFRLAGYDPGRWDTLFLGVDVQRRLQQADGTFSDWSTVNAITQQQRPEYPQPEVYQSGDNFNVSPQDRAAVDAFIEIIDSGKSQLALMRPLFPPTDYGDRWLYPRLEGNVSVLEMDAQYQENPQCRYPECAVDTTVIDEKLRFKDLMEKSEEYLRLKNYPWALAYAEAALANAERANDTRDKDAANELIARIRKAMPKDKEGKLPEQLLWAHDAGIGSVLSGRTYQYRVRAKIYNRYCGTPTLLTDPQAAEIVEMVGEWSEPSEPVTIPQDTMIFVDTARERRNEVKVEIFKWVDGVWVQQDFNVMVGEPIGGVDEVPTPSQPDRPGEAVNFDTGAVAVDIDFHKRYRPKGGRDNKFSGTFSETTSLVYMDASGQLHEQLLDVDKESDLYKEMRAQAWEPPRTRGR